KLTIAETLEGFELKRGKCRIGADEANGYQVSPVRIPVRSLRQESHDQSNQERSRNVDHKRPVREARSQPVADISSQPEACDGADKSSDTYHPVLIHVSSRNLRRAFGLPQSCRALQPVRGTSSPRVQNATYTWILTGSLPDA